MAHRKTRTTTDAIKNRYDAGGTGRRIAAWNPPASGPQRAVEGMSKVRTRARDSVRNDWAAASVVQKWATHLIGVGIVPRWKNKKFKPLWDAHVKVCDADGVLDAYGMQTLGVRGWFEGGEEFIRRRPRELDGTTTPVQYQLIESEYCPMFDANTWPGMPDGFTIRQGIERDNRGRRTAYWFYKEHPGDRPSHPAPDMLIRVAASQVRHCFEPKRAGQLRGVSELASMLVRLRATGDFEDAVLDKQKLSNLFVAFITRALPPEHDIDYDPETGLPKWYDKGGTPMQGMEPGISQQLQPGESVQFANPPEPGTTYSDYLRSTHLGTAAGGGLPYEIMSGDIKEVSDRTLRVLINEFRRLAEQRQWQIVIPMICQPMVDWFAEAAFLAGQITQAELAEAKTCVWSPHGWEYLHPTQDAEGKKILIEAGLTSRTRVIGERGDDAEEIDNERSEEKKRADKLGISPPDPIKLAEAGKAAPAAPAPAKPKPTAHEQALEALALRRATIEVEAIERGPAAPVAAEPSAVEKAFMSMAAQLAEDHAAGRKENAALAQSFAAIASLLAEREMVVNVEPTPITNVLEQTVNVEPTPITNVLEQTITNNVAAPNVAITNDVQPAAISEIAIVSMPERKTTTTIDRHPQTDEITNTTQIERDTPPKKGTEK